MAAIGAGAVALTSIPSARRLYRRRKVERRYKLHEFPIQSASPFRRRQASEARLALLIRLEKGLSDLSFSDQEELRLLISLKARVQNPAWWEIIANKPIYQQDFGDYLVRMFLDEPSP